MPPDHWSYSVLRRMDAAGLLPAGSDVARRSIPHAEIATLLTGEYLRHFQEEFDVARPLHGSTTISGSIRENQMLAGVGYDTVWVPGEIEGRETDGHALGRLAFSSANFAAAAASSEDGIVELQAILAAGPAGVWAGRREVGYRTGHSTGIVLDHARLDGGGLFLTRPIRIPLLGPVRFETHVAKIDNVLNFQNEQNEIEPWFWTARGSFEPHPRLRIGVNRGMIFGGEGNVEVTAGRLFENLIGIYTSGEGDDSFANQVLSVDFLYRAPTGSLPLALYLDWGTEDASGAWWDVPGITAGAEVSMLPNRDVSFGIERTEFRRNVENNSHWYQNPWFRGGWADASVPFGHPLGGHGYEWRGFVSGGAPALGITADLALFARRRRDQNLFAPPRHGKSVGAALAADVRWSANRRIVLAGETERGRDGAWTASTGSIGLRFVF